MKYIGLGNWNKYNIYMLIAFLCDFFRTSLYGLNSSNSEKPVRIFPFKAKIRNHNLLNKFIRLASFLFGGIFLYLLEIRNKKKKEKTSNKKYEIVTNYTLNKKSESNILHLIVIGILFSLNMIVEDFIDLSDLTFWPLEIFYIAVIFYWIFKYQIYIHKKVAIGIMVAVTIINFIESFFPTSKLKNLENINELTDKNLFDIAIIKYGAYSIPLYYLANELRHIQRDYCWVKSKYLMDIKSLNPYKIYISIGTIGIIFIMILFSIFTYVPCKTFNNINKIENDYFDNNTNETLKLYLEYCSLKDYDENTKTLYLLYDSMKLISREYSNTDKNNMLEIFLLIPLTFIFNIINEISRLMMIRYLEPNNILIYHNFYFFVVRLIQFIINDGDEQYLTLQKFFILEFEEIMAIISSLIYIELLELKFCGFDYELKKNIDKRGTQDIIKGLEIDNDEGNDNNDIAELNTLTDQEIYE